MPSSASTRLRFEIQSLGENLNSWGDTKLNAALNRLEEAIADVVPITLTAANYTLSSSNYVADEARGAVLNLSGTPGGTYQIIIPAVEKTYWVYNGTANDQTIGKSGGTTATIRAGRLTFVFCDGSATYASDPTLDQIKAAAADVSLNSHKLTNVSTPTVSTDAATKGYVDTKTLDTFTAPAADLSLNSKKITNLATPTAATDAATKGYIDTPTSARDMAGFKITTVGAPAASGDAATKGYVDGIAFGSALPGGSVTGSIVYYTGTVGNWSALALLNAGGTTVNMNALGTGTPSALNYLRGDGSWATISGAPDFLLQAQGII